MTNVFKVILKQLLCFFDISFLNDKKIIIFSQKAFLERVVVWGEKNVLQMNMICLDTIINGGSEK